MSKRIFVTSLGKVSKIDRDSLGITEVDSLMLAIAAAYNDLKTLRSLHQKLEDDYEKPERGVTIAHGEFGGTRAVLNKFIVSILNEILNLIAENRNIIVLPSFRQLEAEMPESLLPNWSDIKAVAFEKKQKKKINTHPAEMSFIELLREIRNTTGFHYDREVILESYRSAFRSDKPMRDAAMYTAHRSLEAGEGRFYYMDAATEHLLSRSESESGDELFDRLRKHVNDVLSVFGNLLNVYLRNKPYPKQV